MTESNQERSDLRQLYPKLNAVEQSDLYKVNFIQDKQKAMRDKLSHYRKVKGNWSRVNTMLKTCGIIVSCVLGGASILAAAPFSLPIVAAVLSGVSLGNITLNNLLVEGYTSKRQRYFKMKCDHVNDYLNKMETLFVKCKEDGQITPDEFDQFQRLFNEYESEARAQTVVRSKDLRKARKLAKKELTRQRINQLYSNMVQEQHLK